jgi:molecular chaperone GrpE
VTEERIRFAGPDVSRLADAAATAGGVDDAYVEDDTGEETPEPGGGGATQSVTDSDRQQDGDDADDADGDDALAADMIQEHHDLVAAAHADPRSRAELLSELLDAEARRDEYLDDLRRSHAELENYRKRVVRDSALQRDLGRIDVVSALFEVLDDLDLTRQAASGSSDEALAKGVDLVADKLANALGSVGLERIDATEVGFDPTIHEAVQQVPADGPADEPAVVQVLRPGYRLGERTLRAAMVVVSG